jgi:hypothetical protein
MMGLLKMRMQRIILMSGMLPSEGLHEDQHVSVVSVSQPKSKKYSDHEFWPGKLGAVLTIHTHKWK